MVPTRVSRRRIASRSFMNRTNGASRGSHRRNLAAREPWRQVEQTCVPNKHPVFIGVNYARVNRV